MTLASRTPMLRPAARCALVVIVSASIAAGLTGVARASGEHRRTAAQPARVASAGANIARRHVTGAISAPQAMPIWVVVAGSVGVAVAGLLLGLGVWARRRIANL